MADKNEMTFYSWQLCRICAIESEDLVNLYDEMGISMQLEEKINQYLPISVSREDSLPLCMCLLCINKLNIMHELIASCIRSNCILHRLLDKQTNKLKVQKTHTSSKPNRKVAETSRKERDFNESDKSRKKATFNSYNDISNEDITGNSFNISTSDLRRLHEEISLNTGEDTKNKLERYKKILTKQNITPEHSDTNNSDSCFSTKLPEKTVSGSMNLSSGYEINVNKSPEAYRTEDTNKKNNLEEQSINFKDVHMLNNLPQNCIFKFCSLASPNQDCLQDLKQQDSEKCWNQVYENNTQPILLENSESISEVSRSNNESLLCDHCGKNFANIKNFQGHKCYVDKNFKKIYICDICMKSFHSCFQRRSHMKSHMDEKSYLCEHCSKCFAKKELLKQHLAIHENTHPFQCSVCSYSSTRRGNLFKHLETHSIGAFLCKVCDIHFSSGTALFTHQETHTAQELENKNDSTSVFQCSDCGRFLPSEASLTLHRHMHLEKKPFLCIECGKTFCQKLGLTNHKRLHTLERPYCCSFCEKRFNSKAGKESHERVHTGEKPFICSKCNMQFRCSANLRQHHLAHENVRAFPCSYCNKRFKRREALQIHTRIHTGDKPYVCPVCNQSFTQSGDMKKHMRSHSRSTSLPQSNCEFKLLNRQLKNDFSEPQTVTEVSIADTKSPISEESVSEITVITNDVQEFEIEYESSN